MESDENTIASPGANIDSSIFPGPGGPGNWTVKNTARFLAPEGITGEDFSGASNDSLILFNAFEFDAGKRKAKKLQVGDIYSFVTDTEIRGMLIVNKVDGEATGYIECDIMIQN